MLANYADPDNQTVNLFPDANSVTPGLPLDSPDVVAFLAGGGAINPYEAPPPIPFQFPTLQPFQFWAMIDIAGITNTVRDAVDGISDARKKKVAKAKLDRSLAFHRTDPLIQMLGPVAGLTDDQIDNLWMMASNIA